MTIEIKLTRGQVTIIDDEDKDLTELKWYTRIDDTGYYYAGRSIYYKNTKKYKAQYLHRVIMERILERELKAGEQIDHINRNSLDNRRCNLRVCSDKENNCNRGKIFTSRTTSKYKGVSFVVKGEKKWKAQISKERQWYYLGVFETEEEAALAYNKAAIKHHGEFANLNVIEGEE